VEPSGSIAGANGERPTARRTFHWRVRAIMYEKEKIGVITVKIHYAQTTSIRREDICKCLVNCDTLFLLLVSFSNIIIYIFAKNFMIKLC